MESGELLEPCSRLWPHIKCAYEQMDAANSD
jgi:hypothetical protein